MVPIEVLSPPQKMKIKQVLSVSVQTERHSKMPLSNHNLISIGVQTDQPTHVDLNVKSTRLSQDPVSPEIEQLRAEIAHLKNSNRYGDLLIKLHSAEIELDKNHSIKH